MDVDDSVRNCKFRQCTEEKNIEFCCHCNEYPCDELNKFMNDEWPHHHTIKYNLEFIKKYGKRLWLEQQKRQWSCWSCGAEIKWYQKQCSCGQELETWDIPVEFIT